MISISKSLTSYLANELGQKEVTDNNSSITDLLKPSDIRTFDIDLDKPMSERYTAVWQFFSEDLANMESLFIRELNAMNSSYLQFFEDNQEKFKEA